jgi:hypothetical protein
MQTNLAALHPIIYVRGYAGSAAEIDDTTADPFCGFNIGSTVYRATPDRERGPRKFIFESPVVRLAKDYGYRDVYVDGEDILEHESWDQGLPRQSIIVYRYYDAASRLLGSGKVPKIEEFASGLSRFIAKVRDLVVGHQDYDLAPEQFRCYLVAHSMGGLVCRAFLQNPACDPAQARALVDKLFTYASPHNGIDLAGTNVPSWLGVNDLTNFNRDRMADYLAVEELYQKTSRVDWVPEDRFPSEKIFCLVGTNRADYEAAQGLSRTFAGNGSDGLVRVENAIVCGTREGAPSVPTAKAFVFRSHSGYFGIVNSEEAYQNLTRFLFGDVRVDIWVDIEDITLPDPVQAKAAQGAEVDALYQIEVLASPRGKLWYLTRRVAEEDSVACVRHREYLQTKAKGKPVQLHLSTVFLANRARVVPTRRSLAYSMVLGIRVPDYEIDRRLWINEHFEGGYLYRDAVVVELLPPDQETDPWHIEYDWQSDNLGKASRPLDPKELAGGKVEVLIPFESTTRPGITGRVRFVVGHWNESRI